MNVRLVPPSYSTPSADGQLAALVSPPSCSCEKDLFSPTGFSPRYNPRPLYASGSPPAGLGTRHRRASRRGRNRHSQAPPPPSSLRHRGVPAAVWAPAGPWGARATASRWKPRLCTCQTTAHTCSCKYLGGGGGRVLYLEMAYLCWSTNAYERHNTVTPHLRVHGRGCRRRRLRCFTKHPPPHCRAAPRLGPPGPPSLPREEDGPRAAEAHEEALGKASRNVSK